MFDLKKEKSNNMLSIIFKDDLNLHRSGQGPPNNTNDLVEFGNETSKRRSRFSKRRS